MKHLNIFRCILSVVAVLAFPWMASAQDTINPYNTQQSMTIELHNTNVYYCPMAPPALTDTDWVLSSISNKLLDSNGCFDTWPWYEPRTHGTLLKNWAPSPCGSAPLGIGAHWQRFFTAKRDGAGNTHDIIAGGDSGDRVIISSNEDVDFRASGRIKLKSGFHVMPGARFHAYTEPKYDSIIFSDDFDSIDHNKWYIANGNGDGYGIQSHCSTDTDVADTLDPEALDGHALDIFLRENRTVGGFLDTCHCQLLDYSDHDSCDGTLGVNDTSVIFYSADVRACPFPYLSRTDTPLVPANQHMPYGKYETRKKLPHLLYHTNDWPVGSFEVDINESAGDSADTHYLFPNLHQQIRYGPFKGVFHHCSLGYGNVIFVSHEANWSPVNWPHYLIINNFCYEVWTIGGHSYDSITLAPRSFGFMGWPTSLVNDTTDSVTFYYEKNGGNTADVTTWSVDSTGRKFSAPYHDSSGTWLRFSKVYQPTSVTLTTSGPPHDSVKSFSCHWEYNLNPPHGTGDSGILYLDDPIPSWELHSYTEAYQYSINEDYIANTSPAAAYDMYDTIGDYKYHTFGVEILPHEVRYLYDSNVVLRLPDRMIPPGSPGYPFTLDREPLDVPLGEFDLASDQTSALFQEQKQYFENHTSNPGFRDVTIGVKTYHAAHELIDYVRVWDIPKDVSVPNFSK